MLELFEKFELSELFSENDISLLRFPANFSLKFNEQEVELLFHKSYDPRYDLSIHVVSPHNEKIGYLSFLKNPVFAAKMQTSVYGLLKNGGLISKYDYWVECHPEYMMWCPPSTIDPPQCPAPPRPSQLKRNSSFSGVKSSGETLRGIVNPGHRRTQSLSGIFV